MVFIFNLCPLVKISSIDVFSLHQRLYESPVKQATPTQKSITSSKWAKTVTTEGLDDVRKSLIDKLDDIEAQQGTVSIHSLICAFVHSFSQHSFVCSFVD